MYPLGFKDYKTITLFHSEENGVTKELYLTTTLDYPSSLELWILGADNKYEISRKIYLTGEEQRFFEEFLKEREGTNNGTKNN
jgi:hypothetical protein